MRITYDPEADALYLALREAKPSDSRDIADGVTLDLDASGGIVGLEVLEASKRLGKKVLALA